MTSEAPTDDTNRDRTPTSAYVLGYKGRVPTSLDDRVGHEIIVVEFDDGTEEEFPTLTKAKEQVPDVDTYCPHSEPAAGDWRSLQPDSDHE